MYEIQYTSDIVSNDGYKICEKRTFDSVKEMLMASKGRFHLDINDDLSWVKQIARTIGDVCLQIKNPKVMVAGAILKAGDEVTDIVLPMLEKITFDEEQIKWTFEKMDKLFGKNDSLEKFKARFNNPDIGKILGYPSNMKLLDGKSFYLEYEDGVGLVKVDIEDKDKILNSREKELIERAFYLSDYYIFKDKDNPDRVLMQGDSFMRV